jgi:DNA-binding NarL/FixJ family response regulator
MGATAMSPARRIRILVADDHPVVRDGLTAMLGTQPDLEVVGEASSGADALRRVAELAPDVMLLDLEMPGMDGVATLRQLRSGRPTVRVVVFTAYDTPERILAALQAGAHGYLLKGAPREEVFQAIRVANAGGAPLQPQVAARLLRHLSGDAPVAPETLTTREQEVLQLLARGKSNKEIASTLVITERTAKFHVAAILRKLGAANRTEAVTLAAQRGLVDL